MNWPGSPSTESPMGKWLRDFLNIARASSIVSVIGGRLSQGPSGTVLTIDPQTAVVGWHWHDINNREYDQTASYTQNEVVIVSSSNSAVTTGVAKSATQLASETAALKPGDPTPAKNNFATPGRWVYVGTAGSTENSIVHVPIWPLPTSAKDSFGVETNPVCWELISLGPMDYVDCENGAEKKLYVNASEPPA